jgi:hypothetical protein
VDLDRTVDDSYSICVCAIAPWGRSKVGAAHDARASSAPEENPAGRKRRRVDMLNRLKKTQLKKTTFSNRPVTYSFESPLAARDSAICIPAAHAAPRHVAEHLAQTSH